MLIINNIKTHEKTLTRALPSAPLLIILIPHDDRRTVLLRGEAYVEGTQLTFRGIESAPALSF